MNFITQLRRYRWIVTGRWKIRKEILAAKSKGSIKIVVGSGDTDFEGWTGTDLPHFNILKKEDWQYFFEGCTIDNLLAEHVFEHLTQEQTQLAVELAYPFMKTGAVFRIAVPDGFNPDPIYIEHVKPGGNGDGADDHKILWNYKTLAQTGEKAGYKTELKEYHTEEGKFIENELSDERGYVYRRNRNKHPDAKSSLIIDFVK
jgi:predicted SAM-dependent methyltransferase